MTAILSDPLFEQHDTGRHPENARRLQAIREELERSKIARGCRTISPVAAGFEQIEAVHAGDYIRRVQQLADDGGGRLDPDTAVSRRSYDVALHAGGAACQAVDQVVQEKGPNALCLVRPPGHHALPARGMGFCLFNNVAVAARHAQAKHDLERILIVDWDVHHGNGTQDIFYEDGHVVFFSIHRFPFYPGSGTAEETGSGDGQGATFNVPVSFGTSREDYFSAFEATLEKAAQRARPQLVLISAGFDAHHLDPIGSLGLETEDFGRLTNLVMEVATTYCDGRLVSLLEGGYHPQALAESVRLHLETLAS